MEIRYCNYNCQDEDCSNCSKFFGSAFDGLESVRLKAIEHAKENEHYVHVFVNGRFVLSISPKGECSNIYLGTLEYLGIIGN